MTSSGTYAFEPSNGELVLSAYERLQIYAPSLRQEHMAAARREFNFLFASWGNRQVNLWEVIRTQATLTASTATITGVPTDVFRVLLIEPRDVTSGVSGREIHFVAKDYNSREMIAARSISAVDANVMGGGVIYYAITQAGAPVGAPTIYVAPQVTSALTLRLVYVPIQAAVASSGNNPIPGESDNALVAWTVAYARAKEREDRSPDPNWLTVYGTEKQNILVRLAPRDESEPAYADGMFEGMCL